MTCMTYKYYKLHIVPDIIYKSPLYNLTLLVLHTLFYSLIRNTISIAKQPQQLSGWEGARYVEFTPQLQLCFPIIYYNCNVHDV